MLILDPKLFHLPHFGHNKNYHQKNGLCNFHMFFETELYAEKSEKSNLPILRKQCYRKTGRQTDQQR